MRETVTCPACGKTAELAEQIDTIGICGACGATLTLDGDLVRHATGAETTALDAGTLQQLRRARGRIARPERRQV